MVLQSLKNKKKKMVLQLRPPSGACMDPVQKTETIICSAVNKLIPLVQAADNEFFFCLFRQTGRLAGQFTCPLNNETVRRAEEFTDENGAMYLNIVY